MAQAAQVTGRQQRERDYYDVYGPQRALRDTISLEPVDSPQRRPWNPDWRIVDLVKDCNTPGARLLDFGCGWGNNTVVFAKLGYAVDGFDISPGNIEATRRRAAAYGVSERVRAQVAAAETLPYADGTFDVVVGVDILHHVDIPKAIAEVHRVLRRGGTAIFREPMQQPVFDLARNSALGRWAVPIKASFERHCTADERKVSAADLRAMRGAFPSLRVESYRILSRLDVLLPSRTEQLEKLDRALTALPGYAWWRGTGIFVMTRTG
jgi:2-polyprenyl-3-methyl-5-hydroxy-6-metoxy-1,4-benzoquinol methylase